MVHCFIVCWTPYHTFGEVHLHPGSTLCYIDIGRRCLILIVIILPFAGVLLLRELEGYRLPESNVLHTSYMKLPYLRQIYETSNSSPHHEIWHPGYDRYTDDDMMWDIIMTLISGSNHLSQSHLVPNIVGPKGAVV